eukprot:4604455-Amphidinium_carterae.1
MSRPRLRGTVVNLAVLSRTAGIPSVHRGTRHGAAPDELIDIYIDFQASRLKVESVTCGTGAQYGFPELSLQLFFESLVHIILFNMVMRGRESP